jgi:hypothetical protein
MRQKLYAEAQGKTHFCKYVTANTAKIILTSLKGKWSSPLLFNDPFDMQTEIKFDFNIEDLEEPVISEISRLALHDKDVDLKKDPLEIQRWRIMSEHISPEKLRKELRDAIHSILPELYKTLEKGNEDLQTLASVARIFCVVEKHDNLLMWAHYAKDHTGAVINFKLIPEKDTGLCAAFPITYINDENKLPTIDSIERWVKSLIGQEPVDYKKEVFEKYCFKKSNHWQYEEEWRVLGIKRNPEEKALYELRSFLPEEFDTIYLGCKMENSDRDEILRCLTGSLSHVQVYQAKKSKTKYELDFEKIR